MNRWKFFKYLVIGICLLPTLTIQAKVPEKSSSRNKIVKLLTVGNSFAQNACTFLPQITESVPGYEIIITEANIGGCSLEKHAGLIEECEKNADLKPYHKKYCLKDLLSMDNYDFITIQQVSTLSFRPESYYPYADKLYQHIQDHSVNSEIVIHQTWAYSPESKRFKEWDISRQEMQDGLVKSYTIIAKQFGLDIVPSGNAFYSSFKKKPNIDLWKEDRYHANTNGCYLAGCVWFGKFFGVSPRKVRFVPEGMDKKTARFLRKIAAKESK